ncbi:hypothetical protein ACFSTC_13420 [Nonomuraea ferruginea]
MAPLRAPLLGGVDDEGEALDVVAGRIRHQIIPWMRPVGEPAARWLRLVVRMMDLPPSWPPGNGRRKIGKSNTVSIELPYDVLHHTADIFEEDSNNCLKMIFNRDTVAVCDIRTTDREPRPRGGLPGEEERHERAG